MFLLNWFYKYILSFVLDDQFSQIYSLYDEAMVNCCGQSYFLWLNSLPSVFEMKVMDIIDPCTFWVHISDGVSRRLIVLVSTESSFSLRKTLLHVLCFKCFSSLTI